MSGANEAWVPDAIRESREAVVAVLNASAGRADNVVLAALESLRHLSPGQWSLANYINTPAYLGTSREGAAPPDPEAALAPHGSVGV